VSTDNTVDATAMANETTANGPAPTGTVAPAETAQTDSSVVNTALDSTNNAAVNTVSSDNADSVPQTTPAADAAVLENGLPSGVNADGTIADVAANTPVDLMTQLQDFLTVGGPVVWILMGFSVIALCIVLVKIWQFALLRPESTGDVRKSLLAWRKGENQEAIAALKTRRPVSEVTSMAMHGLSRTSADHSLLKEELERVATNRMNQLRAFLRPLEVIATLSPLLGLLGTVLGMIVAFQQMEAAGSQVDPSVLSGGIWQALLTTAVGLVVAIPVVAIHTWLERKVERVSALMNDSVTQVFTSHQSVSLSRAKAEEIKRAA